MCRQFLIDYELFDLQVIGIPKYERELCHLISIASLQSYDLTD